MRVVFIKKDCLSRISPAVTADLCLQSGVLEGLQTLRRQDMVIALLDAAMRPVEPAKTSDSTDRLLRVLVRGGAKVDALIRCPHAAGSDCGCWGEHAGFLHAAAAELDLRLSDCYLICDAPSDIEIAIEAGCRPILVLNDREIGSMYDGHQPEVAGFPSAPDFASAVRYIQYEEEANDLWGHARQPAVVQEIESASVAAMPEFSPNITLLSPVRTKSLQLPSFAPLSRSARQYLLLFIVGGVWLSLGIAYLLAHLYRVHPFPQFVWYLTLQFIPRPLRGLGFIAGGMFIVLLSLRAFAQLVPNHKQRPRA